jgi:cytoskeletal protein CcmA (bactofilin family)
MGKAPSNGINSLLGEGSSYEGTARVGGAVRVDGNWKGSVEVTETLVVGRTGVFTGDVHARDVIVCGRLVGTISATGSVELQKGCRFEGDVETPIFVVEEGVFFQGNCRMPREAETGYAESAAGAAAAVRTGDATISRAQARSEPALRDSAASAGNGPPPSPAHVLAPPMRSAAG